MKADAPHQACPSCGNPVHPVAGRCRHCQVDLVGLRSKARRAARLAAPRAQLVVPPALPSPPDPTPVPTAITRPRLTAWVPRILFAFLVACGGFGAGFAAERFLR